MAEDPNEVLPVKREAFSCTWELFSMLLWSNIRNFWSKYPSLDPDTSLSCKPVSLPYGTSQGPSLLLAGGSERWTLLGESLIYSLLFILQHNDLSYVALRVPRWPIDIQMLVMLNMRMVEKMMPIRFHSEFKVKSVLDFGGRSCLQNLGPMVALSETTKKLLRGPPYILSLSQPSKWSHLQKAFSMPSTQSLQLSKTLLRFLVRIVDQRLQKKFYRSFGPAISFYG